MFVCLTHTGQFRLEFGTVGFELFCKILCHGKCFERVVALPFCSIESFLKMCSIDLLLVDEKCKTMSLAFVLLDLRFEFLCFLSKLRSKSLEFLELQLVNE